MGGGGRRGKLAAGLLLATGYAAGVFGCANLFHSTDFGNCGAEGDGGCAGIGSGDGAPRPDATHGGKDAAKDVTTAKDVTSAKPTDATTDHETRKPDAADAGRDASDARGSTHDALADQGVDAGYDASTDFCSSSPAEAQARAQHACLWLGACEGAPSSDTTTLNSYGECYGVALLAYDCAANPGQRVTGPVHAYWDALWQAKTCADVTHALFPQGTPPCNAGALSGCFSNYPDVAFQCADAGATPTGQNCAAQGYTCIDGDCFVKHAASCDAATDALVSGSSCEGTILHLCQHTQNVDGPRPLNYDLGTDCRYFGAGACIADGGVAGCAPADAGSAHNAGAGCVPNPLATCSRDGGYALGCPTGKLQVVDCVGLGAAGCTVGQQGDYFPSVDLGKACSSPRSDSIPQCMAGQVVGFNSLFGIVGGDCSDAGLAPCDASAYSPVCNPPPGH